MDADGRVHRAALRVRANSGPRGEELAVKLRENHKANTQSQWQWDTALASCAFPYSTAECVLNVVQPSGTRVSRHHRRYKTVRLHCSHRKPHSSLIPDAHAVPILLLVVGTVTDSVAFPVKGLVLCRMS